MTKPKDEFSFGDFLNSIGSTPPAPDPTQAWEISMAEQAKVIFACFNSLIVAGFTRKEAFTLFLHLLPTFYSDDSDE